ncbi:hypothetical protein FIBSPDRAFT_5581 [Athelia psychrophila]|uniref:BTB domain-containing protein n=1 Tax=Athelia psychrophila TaxID=1759441 RepID=A0A166X1E7_9AGAM|nr:hypothetical protein FIBSPDRAFT_5581 [Fibularhizoctonia sp. CBS 109695]
MSSPTSTTVDIADSPPPSVIADTMSTLASVTPEARHYASDVLTVFKVEDKLFRFDRTLLDQEMDTMNRLGGVGSKEDPIELKYIKAADFAILLDFLKLGTRHDKKPLTAFDWTCIFGVCSILGMHRVQTIARESLSDPQRALLDHQRRLLNQQNAPLSCAGVGFERDARGMYFLIREGHNTLPRHLWCFEYRRHPGAAMRTRGCSSSTGLARCIMLRVDWRLI